MNIPLHPGEHYTWKDAAGTEHTVSVTRFLEHDHEHLTVYYLDFPLSEEDLEEEKDSLVVSVRGFGFSEPYTGTLQPGTTWKFNRCPQGELFFERPDEREEVIIWFTPKV